MVDLELRRHGIGASEVGAIFGVHPWLTAFSLRAEKRGEIPRREPDMRVRLGQAFEVGVLSLYSYATGREVDHCGHTMQHPERPWMVYTPDALCRGERRGVDAKVTHWDQRNKWGETADEIPEYIQLQCWYYMAALDYDVWDVAAMVIGEDAPRIYEIPRDREAERAMLERVEEFWVRYIQGSEQLPIDGSDAASAWLQQRFPRHRRPDLREATRPEQLLLEEYVDVRLFEREAKERRARLENQIKLAIADKEGLTWPDGKFTWRRTKDGSATDWEKLAEALLADYVEDPKMRRRAIAEHTQPRPGGRRIRIDCAQLREAPETAEAGGAS